MKQAKRLTRNEKIALTEQLVKKAYALSCSEAEQRLKEMTSEERNKLSKHVADTNT